MGAVPLASASLGLYQGIGVGMVSAGDSQREAGQVRSLCILTEVPWEKELGCYSQAARGAQSTGRLQGMG